MNNMPENVTPAPAPKKKNIYTVTHGVFALLVLILGSLWYRWIFLDVSHKGLFKSCISLPVGLFALLFIIFSLSFYYFRKIKLSSDSYILLSALIVFSARYFIYPNTKDDMFSISTLVLHLVVLLFLRSVGRPELLDRIVPDTARALIDPFISFGAFFGAIGAFFLPLKKRTDKESAKRVGKEVIFVICGIALSLPLIMVIISLLASDGFFSEYVGELIKALGKLDLYKIKNYFNIITILVSLYIFGALYSSETKRTMEFEKPIANRILPSTVIATVNVILVIIYAFFALSQLDGIISIVRNTLPEGKTYAEFARSGFFELCFVACINGAVLYFSEILLIKDEKKHSRLPSILVICSTFFLILTAASKMIYYISAYGFTEKRFYTLWFMLLLLIVFSLVLVKIKKYEFRLSRYSVYVTLIMLAILFLIDFNEISEYLNSAYFPSTVM